jgi:hypothetical protein
MNEIKLAWFLFGLAGGFAWGVALTRLWLGGGFRPRRRKDIDCCCGHPLYLHIEGPPSVCGVGYCLCVQYVPASEREAAEREAAEWTTATDEEYAEWLRRERQSQSKPGPN